MDSDEGSLSETERSVGMLNSRKRKRTFEVWDVFRRLDEIYAVCLACEEQGMSTCLAYQTQTGKPQVQNLRRHFKTKHRKQDWNFKTEMQGNMDGEQGSSRETERSVGMPKSHKRKKKKGNARFEIWDWYTRLDDTYAVCNACEELGIETNFAYQAKNGAGNRKGNLRRHYVKQHWGKKQNKAKRRIKSKERKRDSRVWDLFTILDSKYAECKECKEHLVYENEAGFSQVGNLQRHYKQKHHRDKNQNKDEAHNHAQISYEETPDFAEEEVFPEEVCKTKASNKRSRVWNLFTILDDKYAECNDCEAVLAYKDTSGKNRTGNLRQHYQNVHWQKNQNKDEARNHTQISYEETPDFAEEDGILRNLLKKRKVESSPNKNRVKSKGKMAFPSRKKAKNHSKHSKTKFRDSMEAESCSRMNERSEVMNVRSESTTSYQMPAPTPPMGMHMMPWKEDKTPQLLNTYNKIKTQGDMIEAMIKSALPTLQGDKVSEIYNFLVNDMGVENVEDLAFIEVEDLNKVLKPVQSRKLIAIWKNKGMPNYGSNQPCPSEPVNFVPAVFQIQGMPSDDKVYQVFHPPASEDPSQQSFVIPRWPNSVQPSVQDVYPDYKGSEVYTNPDLVTAPQKETKYETPLPSLSSEDWPDTFEIPWQNVPPEIMKCLHKKKRPNRMERFQLIHVVADDIFKISRNPAPNEIEKIGRKMMRKFPTSLCDEKSKKSCKKLVDQLLNRLKTMRGYSQKDSDSPEDDESPESSRPPKKKAKLSLLPKNTEASSSKSDASTSNVQATDLMSDFQIPWHKLKENVLDMLNNYIPLPKSAKENLVITVVDEYLLQNREPNNLQADVRSIAKEMCKAYPQSLSGKAFGRVDGNKNPSTALFKSLYRRVNFVTTGSKQIKVDCLDISEDECSPPESTATSSCSKSFSGETSKLQAIDSIPGFQIPWHKLQESVLDALGKCKKLNKYGRQHLVHIVADEYFPYHTPDNLTTDTQIIAKEMFKVYPLSLSDKAFGKDGGNKYASTALFKSLYWRVVRLNRTRKGTVKTSSIPSEEVNVPTSFSYEPSDYPAVKELSIQLIDIKSLSSVAQDTDFSSGSSVCGHFNIPWQKLPQTLLDALNNNQPLSKLQKQDLVCIVIDEYFLRKPRTKQIKEETERIAKEMFQIYPSSLSDKAYMLGGGSKSEYTALAKTLGSRLRFKNFQFNRDGFSKLYIKPGTSKEISAGTENDFPIPWDELDESLLSNLNRKQALSASDVEDLVRVVCKEYFQWDHKSGNRMEDIQQIAKQMCKKYPSSLANQAFGKQGGKNGSSHLFNALRECLQSIQATFFEEDSSCWFDNGMTETDGLMFDGNGKDCSLPSTSTMVDFIVPWHKLDSSVFASLNQKKALAPDEKENLVRVVCDEYLLWDGKSSSMNEDVKRIVKQMYEIYPLSLSNTAFGKPEGKTETSYLFNALTYHLKYKRIKTKPQSTKETDFFDKEDSLDTSGKFEAGTEFPDDDSSCSSDEDHALPGSICVENDFVIPLHKLDKSVLDALNNNELLTLDQIKEMADVVSKKFLKWNRNSLMTTKYTRQIATQLLEMYPVSLSNCVLPVSKKCDGTPVSSLTYLMSSKIYNLRYKKRTKKQISSEEDDSDSLFSQQEHKKQVSAKLKLGQRGSNMNKSRKSASKSTRFVDLQKSSCSIATKEPSLPVTFESGNFFIPWHKMDESVLDSLIAGEQLDQEDKISMVHIVCAEFSRWQPDFNHVALQHECSRELAHSMVQMFPESLSNTALGKPLGKEKDRSQFSSLFDSMRHKFRNMKKLAKWRDRSAMKEEGDSKVADWAMSFLIPWAKMAPEMLEILKNEERLSPTLRSEMVRIVSGDIQQIELNPNKDSLDHIAEKMCALYPKSLCDKSGEVVGQKHEILSWEIFWRIQKNNYARKCSIQEEIREKESVYSLGTSMPADKEIIYVLRSILSNVEGAIEGNSNVPLRRNKRKRLDVSETSTSADEECIDILDDIISKVEVPMEMDSYVKTNPTGCRSTTDLNCDSIPKISQVYPSKVVTSSSTNQYAENIIQNSMTNPKVGVGTSSSTNDKHAEKSSYNPVTNTSTGGSDTSLGANTNQFEETGTESPVTKTGNVAMDTISSTSQHLENNVENSVTNTNCSSETFTGCPVTDTGDIGMDLSSTTKQHIKNSPGSLVTNTSNVSLDTQHAETTTENPVKSTGNIGIDACSDANQYTKNSVENPVINPGNVGTERSFNSSQCAEDSSVNSQTNTSNVGSNKALEPAKKQDVAVSDSDTKYTKLGTHSGNVDQNCSIKSAKFPSKIVSDSNRVSPANAHPEYHSANPAYYGSTNPANVSPNYSSSNRANAIPYYNSPNRPNAAPYYGSPNRPNADPYYSSLNPADVSYYSSPNPPNFFPTYGPQNPVNVVPHYSPPNPRYVAPYRSSSNQANVPRYGPLNHVPYYGSANSINHEPYYSSTNPENR